MKEVPLPSEFLLVVFFFSNKCVMEMLNHKEKRKEGLNGESEEKGKGNINLGTLKIQIYDSILECLLYLRRYNTLFQELNEV